MKYLQIIIVLIFIVFSKTVNAQIGTVKTESYKAKFETEQSIDAVPDYKDTLKIPIQLLSLVHI